MEWTKTAPVLKALSSGRSALEYEEEPQQYVEDNKELKRLLAQAGVSQQAQASGPLARRFSPGCGWSNLAAPLVYFVWARKAGLADRYAKEMYDTKHNMRKSVDQTSHVPSVILNELQMGGGML
jgi:hypothetical protein